MSIQTQDPTQINVAAELVSEFCHLLGNHLLPFASDPVGQTSFARRQRLETFRPGAVAAIDRVLKLVAQVPRIRLPIDPDTAELLKECRTLLEHGTQPDLEQLTGCIGELRNSFDREFSRLLADPAFLEAMVETREYLRSASTTDPYRVQRSIEDQAVSMGPEPERLLRLLDYPATLVVLDDLIRIDAPMMR